MLREVEGVLDLTTPASPGKYGTPTQFRLSGDTRIYQYISKSGEMGKVEEELLKSKALPVRVLVDPRDQFSTVLELEINGRIVRSYDDIVTAWRADGRLGMWAASVFGTAGVVMFALSRKQYRDA